MAGRGTVGTKKEVTRQWRLWRDQQEVTVKMYLFSANCLWLRAREQLSFLRGEERQKAEKWICGTQVDGFSIKNNFSTNTAVHSERVAWYNLGFPVTGYLSGIILLEMQ